jgi:hypothetical protein
MLRFLSLRSLGCAALACCALWLAACDDEEDVALGGAGESCTRRADCAEGLSCIAEVCSAASADAGMSTPPAAEGGDCLARSDCRAGLVCNEGRCEQAPLGVDPDNRYGGRGESCQAKNDCEGELACVGNACREVTLSLARTEKDCYRVECAETDECCAAFVPNENCEAYRENCETDPIFCNTYRSLCECNLECVDQVCLAAAQGCETHEECGSTQTPFCVSGRCSQCGDDVDCAGAGTQCVAGVCMAACTIDENCPSLHTCQESVCVDTGCTSDRECVFATHDPLARCVESECSVPCDDDADCTSEQSPFQVCESERCVFVGCENDAECRALLNLSSAPGKTQAVCR